MNAPKKRPLTSSHGTTNRSEKAQNNQKGKVVDGDLLASELQNKLSEVDEVEVLRRKKIQNDMAVDPIFTNKGNHYPQIHGKYFLLDHLVDGGMAKVCRARYLGEGDHADKMVAIKMIQEKYSADSEFVQMFLDEIKVSFGLNHPNINTTFDYGKIGKNLFVSMEYIHGKDLMDVIKELKNLDRTLSVPMAMFIAIKMSEGLHYAHNFTNKLTGQCYNIVHRDISPHNIMLSYEGYVKVIDFGIAKADTNKTVEDDAVVKGKVNYFAPEYLLGKGVDHRYDQFAVALTLWEMLTGRKHFQEKGQTETLKSIIACGYTPASNYNKKVPAFLEKILAKALSKDPRKRFENMEAFQRELLKKLYQRYPDFHEGDISKLMKTLFYQDYERDLEAFKGYGKYSIKDIVEKINAFKEYKKDLKKSGVEESNKGREKEIVFDFGFAEESVSVLDSKRSNKKFTLAIDRNSKTSLNKRKKKTREQENLSKMVKGKKNQDPFIYKFKSAFLVLGLLIGGYAQRDFILEFLSFEELSKDKVEVTQTEEQEIVPQEEANDFESNLKFLNKMKNRKEKKQKNKRSKEAVALKEALLKDIKEAQKEIPESKIEQSTKTLTKPNVFVEGSKIENESIESDPVVEKALEEAKLKNETSKMPEEITEVDRLQETEQEEEPNLNDRDPASKNNGDDVEREEDLIKNRMKEQLENVLDDKQAIEEDTSESVNTQRTKNEDAARLLLKQKMLQKLNNIDEKAPEKVNTKEPSFFEKIGDFIRRRRAFSWMFND